MFALLIYLPRSIGSVIDIDIIFHVEIFAVLLIFLSIISSSVLEVKYLDKLLVFLWVRTAHRC